MLKFRDWNSRRGDDGGWQARPISVGAIGKTGKISKVDAGHRPIFSDAAISGAFCSRSAAAVSPYRGSAPPLEVAKRFTVMASGFAGSRGLEDRRRRRLAKETDESASSARGGEGAARRRRKKSADQERAGTRLPLRKIISRHRWKIWLLGFLLMIPAAGIVFGAFRLDAVARSAGPAVAQLLDPAENRLGRAWGSFLLLISCEMSVLIWWVRSRSPSDFHGRFGVWLWAAAGCFLFSACVATNAHLYFSETVLHFRLVHFPQLGLENTKTLCWLAPSGLFGAGIVRSLYLDMRRCWSSVLTLSMAVAGWLGAAYLLSQTPSAAQIPHRELGALASALTGHVSLLLSMLLHARFVLYESSAPPPEAPARKSLLSLVRVIRRDGEEAPAETAEEEAPRKVRGSTKKASKPSRKVPARKPAKEEPESSDDAATGDGEVDDDASAGNDAFQRSQPTNRGAVGGTAKPPASPGPASAGKNVPPAKPDPKPASPPALVSEDSDDDSDGDDGAEDKSALKGLSKRERRRLQKQWREQQRG